MFKQISQTSGFSSIQTNAGSIRNTGIEFSINATPVQTQDFEWTIGANITYNKNQITDLGVWANEENKFVDGDVLYEVGKALGTWYMVEHAGVNPETGEVWFSDQKVDIQKIWIRLRRLISLNLQKYLYLVVLIQV